MAVVKRRQLFDNIPSSWLPGAHWVLEAYESDNSDLPYPIGQAWLTVISDQFISVDFILVPDHFRREGIATLLYNEIIKCWPSAMLTDAISDAGEKLLESIYPWRAKAREEQARAKLKAKKLRRKRLRK